jgi:hypothetical protein
MRAFVAFILLREADMNNLEEQLTQNLYRAACPSSLELGEYELGMVTAERKSWIQAHLGDCRFCTAELAQLQEYFADLKPDLELTLAERAGSRVQTWFARLLPDSGPLAQPGLALRGNQNELLSYEAGEAQLHLEVQVDPRQSDRRSLLGLLVGVEPQEVEACLVRGAEVIQRVSLDELSNFTFPAIQPNEYTLLVRGPEFEIIVGSLPVF